MSLLRKEIFEFGDFRLDVSEHTIERIDGTPNGSITEKAFQALVLLVRRHGHLVSKDELIRFIWPDTIVEENNLEKCIHHLRHFLRETPEGTPYIETIRKHGYRFVGNVQKIEVSGSWIPESFRFADQQTGLTAALTATSVPDVNEPPTLDDESEAAVENRFGRVQERSYSYLSRVAAIGTFLVCLAAVIALGYYFFVRSSVTIDGSRSIAVLPMRPIDPATGSDIHEFGMADVLINRLSSIKGFVVRPLTATRKYRGTDQDPMDAGREQRVDYVVASNYQIANGRIKVTSQLLNVATARVEDTFNLEKDSTNLFAAQDAIADEISAKLAARFGSVIARFPSERGTDNEEAYKFYVLAINLSEERGIQNVQKALAYLDRDVALDPNFARAWATKALTHQDIVAHTDLGQQEHYQNSTEAIRKAIAIDPDLSEAYSASCFNKNRYEYDPSAAEAACKRAVELDPNSPVAHRAYANFLYTRGSFDQAIVEIETTMDLQPVSFRNQQMYGLTLYFAGRYEQAEEQFKRLIELNPNHSYAHGRLIRILEEQGKEPEAFDHLIKMLTIQQTDNETLGRLRAAYRGSGWRGVLMERIKTAEAESNPGYFQIASLYAKVGDKDKAIECLEKAYQQRSFQMAVLQVEPQLESLHDDPRFADIVSRVGGR